MAPPLEQEVCLIGLMGSSAQAGTGCIKQCGRLPGTELACFELTSLFYSDMQETEKEMYRWGETAVAGLEVENIFNVEGVNLKSGFTMFPNNNLARFCWTFDPKSKFGGQPQTAKYIDVTLNVSCNIFIP